MVQPESLFALPKMKVLSLGLFIALLWGFLFVNAPGIYGDFAPQMRDIFNVYIGLFVLVLGVLAMTGLKIRIPEFSEPIRDQLIKFVVGFVITGFLMMFVVFVVPTFSAVVASTEIVILAAGFGLIHSFVKAFIEEIVFRSWLPSAFGLQVIGSSVVFGLFHFAVTGVNPFAMVYLMFAGFAFAVAHKYLGLMGATGAHTAHNIIALGLGTAVFGLGLL